MNLALANSYVNGELAWYASSALPSDYEIELPAEHDCRSKDAGCCCSLLGDDGLLVVLDALRDNLREWDCDSNLAFFNDRPIYDLVEIFIRDDNSNVESVIAAKIFEYETGFYFIPLTFPANKGVIRILKHLSLDERVGFLTEIVRVFRNLVRLGGGVESFNRDVVRLLGQFVGLLRLAISEHSDTDADNADTDADNPPVHEESLDAAQAWSEYLDRSKTAYGWNPRKVFQAGWDARGGDCE